MLVVEDELLVAMDLELLLQRHGWRVLGPATTLAEALRLLADGYPTWRCSTSTYEASW